jgi:hypothetical protein
MSCAPEKRSSPRSRAPAQLLATGATGEWNGGRYFFSQKGWFNQRILVRGEPTTGDVAPLATFTRRGGVLTFADGRTLAWKKPSVWRSKRIWMDGAASLVEFDPANGYASPRVTITPEGAPLAELPLLLLLGQYLIVRTREDADAASAATTTIIAST